MDSFQDICFQVKFTQTLTAKFPASFHMYRLSTHSERTVDSTLKMLMKQHRKCFQFSLLFSLHKRGM